MQSEDILKTFQALHSIISNLTDEEIKELTNKASAENQWFTFESTKQAFEGISFILRPSELEVWVQKYPSNKVKTKTIGLVCAGNIPMVGFHDLLCVLMAGHKAHLNSPS